MVLASKVKRKASRRGAGGAGDPPFRAFSDNERARLDDPNPVRQR